MNKVKIGLLLGLMAGVATVPVEAQVNASDSVQHHVLGNRLSVGGYGEIAYSRNFYSDNVYRYSDAAKYKNDPSHGRFDVPHAVIYLNYNFGKGWTMGTEIEFEHTGTGIIRQSKSTRFPIKKYKNGTCFSRPVFCIPFTPRKGAFSPLLIVYFTSWKVVE